MDPPSDGSPWSLAKSGCPLNHYSALLFERTNVTNTVIVNRTVIQNVNVTNVTYVNRNVVGAVTVVLMLV